MNPQIVKAVLSHSSLNAVEFCDVASHGADCGTSGFIYYTETEAFYNANENLINTLLEEVRENVYEDEVSTIEMLKGFGRSSDLNYIYSGVDFDEEYGEYDYDTIPDFGSEVVHAKLDFDTMQWEAVEKDTYYKNLISWFVLEESSRYISDLLEQGDVEEVESLGVCCEEWKESNGYEG